MWLTFEKYGVDEVFQEKMSGAKKDRPELEKMIDHLAVQFYVEELGFSKLFKEGGHTGMKRHEVELHLYQTNDKHLADWSVIRIQTNNINLYEKLKDKHPNASYSSCIMV